MAGGYLTADGELITEKMTFTDLGGGNALVRYGDLAVELLEDRIILTAPGEFTVENRIGRDDHLPTVAKWSENRLSLSYQGAPYSIVAAIGRFLSPTRVESENGRLELILYPQH